MINKTHYTRAIFSGMQSDDNQQNILSKINWRRLKNYSPRLITITCLIASLTACGGDSYSSDNAAGESSYPTNQGYTPNPVDDEPVSNEPKSKQFRLIEGSDNNSQNQALLSLNPGGPGGSPNQSLRAGDVLVGDEQDDVIIGGLGVDVLLGYGGDDVLIGGTEDFNSSVDGDGRGADNRDRAFGHSGDDAFIWAPGDGSDFFDGGEGIDVVIFGVLGEAQDASGNREGAPFFNVNPPSTEGSQDFDVIHLDENNQPRVRVSASPGFCTVLDAVANQNQFEQLSIDHIVRFSLRAIANQFDAGDRSDDDGLRVSLTLSNTEFLVCTRRDLNSEDPVNNIEVLDIRTATPVAAEISDLPEHIQALIL